MQEIFVEIIDKSGNFVLMSLVIFAEIICLPPQNH